MYISREKLTGPSGYADPPRPFVLRVSHLDGLTVAAGGQFQMVTHSFAPAAMNSVTPELMRRVGHAGLGPARSRFDLLNFSHEEISLNLSADEDLPTDVTVQLVTPTEWKPDNDPGFAVVFARVQDRISALCSFYGNEQLPVDFSAMRDRAKGIRLARAELSAVSVMRRSSRTGQTHDIGGVLGSLRYEGELSEFMPWIRAAEYSGIGRHTVWGNGEIRLR